MFYKFHSESPWLKRVLVPFWTFQLTFMLALISVFVWFRAYPVYQNPDIIVFIISAICTVLSVTEIILFAATMLHPLTYLILQLAKTITWLTLFLVYLAIFRVGEFVETLVLFIAFLGGLIYASVIYQRHRRVKARFFHSIQSTDLIPAIADEESSPVSRPRTRRASKNSVKEIEAVTEVPCPADVTEAVEVTILRELGGDWDVYELPATRSKRSSRGGKSVRSLKGVR